jgi:hypothetical protein
MDPAPSPDHQFADRIAQAEERGHASMVRVCEAQELVIIVKDRLARARLGLKYAQTWEPHDPPTGEDPPVRDASS